MPRMQELMIPDLGYRGLTAGIQKGLDKAYQTKERRETEAFKTQEREAGEKFITGEREDTEAFTAGESEKGRDFLKKERIAGEDFEKKHKYTQEKELKTMDIDARLDLQREINAGLKERIEEKGGWDLKAIDKKGGIDKAITTYIQGELKDRHEIDDTTKKLIAKNALAGAKDRLQMQLDSSENIAKEARILEMDLAKHRGDTFENRRAILKEKLASDEKINKYSVDIKKIIADESIDAQKAMNAIDNLTKTTISTAQIIANKKMQEDRIVAAGDLSEQESEQRMFEYERRLTSDFAQFKDKTELVAAQARILKQQEADKTFAFNPSDFAELYKEQKLLGFDESEILDVWRGGEDAPSMFPAIAKAVQGALQTSEGSSQRQAVIAELVKMQSRMSDPNFYGSGDRLTGESDEAYSNLLGIQNLLQMMGPQGRQAIRTLPDEVKSPSAWQDNILGPTMPALKGMAQGTADVINALIQNTLP